MARSAIESRRIHAEKLAAAKGIQDKADAENRDLTAEEQKQFEGLLAEADRAKADAKRREQIEAATRDLPADDDRPTARPAVKPEDPTQHAGDLPRRTPAEARSREELGRCGFRSLGEFAMVVRGVSAGAPADDPRLLRMRSPEFLRDLFPGQPEAAVTGMSQGVGSEGGWLVPPTFQRKLWDGLMVPELNLIPLCDQYTIEGDSIEIPRWKDSDRSAGLLYGGIEAYWLSEGGQHTAKKGKLEGLKLEPQGIGCMVPVTNKLLRGSFLALDQFLGRALPEAIRFKTMQAIMSGTGAKQPLGIVGAPCTVSVAKETNQIAGSLVRKNVSKMWAALHPACRSRAVWLLSPELEPYLDEFSTIVMNVAGSENVGGYKDDRVYNPEKGTLKGRPIMFTEFCEAAGTVGDIVLADMKGYALGMRGMVESSVSIHLRFDWDETCFKAVWEVDGQPWLLGKAKLLKGTAEYSTFVTLATR